MFANPLVETIISRLAQDETGKRQYYRPVYSLHKWWARRPGALFRAITLLAVNGGSELFKLKEDGSISRNSVYFDSHDLKDVVILDPFMGGGTTLAEANRLGAKVIGCDLNPVAYWVVRETLKPVDLDTLENYYHQLEQDIGERIRGLYRTRCHQCGSDCDSLYVFWLRFVECPSCQEKVYLYKRTLLNRGLSRNKPPSRSNPATTFCPHCLALNDWHGSGQCSCQSCGRGYEPQVGSFDQGYYHCQSCGKERSSLIETLREGQKLKERMLAIEYWCSHCNARLYKSPDANDLKKFNDAEKIFFEKKESFVFPRQNILAGDSSVCGRQRMGANFCILHWRRMETIQRWAGRCRFRSLCLGCKNRLPGSRTDHNLRSSNLCRKNVYWFR